MRVSGVQNIYTVPESTSQHAVSEINTDSAMFNYIEPNDVEFRSLLPKKITSIINFDYKNYFENIEKFYDKKKYIIKKKICNYSFNDEKNIRYEIYDKSTKKLVAQIRGSYSLDGKLYYGMGKSEYDENGKLSKSISVNEENKINEYSEYKNNTRTVFYCNDLDLGKVVYFENDNPDVLYPDNGDHDFINYIEYYANGNVKRAKKKGVGDYIYDENGVLRRKNTKDGIIEYTSDGEEFAITPVINGYRYGGSKIYPLVEKLFENIHAKKWIFPTTGKDFSDNIDKITKENVWDILKQYDKKNKRDTAEYGELTREDKSFWDIYREGPLPFAVYGSIKRCIHKSRKEETLFTAIKRERGLSRKERKQYIKNILKALKESNIIIENGFESKVDQMMQFADKLDVKEINKLYEEIADKLEYRKYLKDHESVRYKEETTKPDGIIDEHSHIHQFGMGDCWLLTNIKALTASEEGKKLLRESLNVKPNGDVEVTLKGVNKTYLVKRQELKEAKEYHHGDGDVRAIEIAVDRYRREEQKSSIQYGWTGEGLYILGAISSKRHKRIFLRDHITKRKMNKIIDKKDNKITLASITIKDNYSDEVSSHSVYVTDINSETVTYWDPTRSDETTMKTEEFRKICNNLNNFEIE